MSQRAIEQWERSFRAAANADGYAILRDHLRRLELPDSPELLLEGTILAVRAGCAYRLWDRSDGKHFEKLLEIQHYDPADSTDARYAFTFDRFDRYSERRWTYFHLHLQLKGNCP